MKKLFILLLVAFTINVNAQDDKTVTLVVSGQGKTQDEAKKNALRSAIEQSFGTFISSKTEILNDNLVKDEIVSVANGNIQKFEIISEVQLPNNDYSTSLNVIVSATKLTSFIKNKGYAVEFGGALFASNVLIQDLYKKNELIAIESLVQTLKIISSSSFDFSISAREPKKINESWNIPINVTAMVNKNFINFQNLLFSTIKNLSLSASDQLNYKKLGVKFYAITIANTEDVGTFYFRNSESIMIILKSIYNFNEDISSINISNGIEKLTLANYKNLSIRDESFRPLLFTVGQAISCPVASSLFYYYCNSMFYQEGSISFNKDQVYQCQSAALQHEFNALDFSSLPIGYNKNSENECGLFDGEPKYNDSFEAFYPLKKQILSGTELGLIISFANIKPYLTRITFSFNDIRSIEEIKKITKFEIEKN